MTKIKEDLITDFNDLKSRFNLVKSDFKAHFNISDLSHIDIIDDIMYLYFLDNNNQVTDRIHYKFIGDNGFIYEGDHVVKGVSLNEIYRDLEFVTVNYIFGIIC